MRNPKVEEEVLNHYLIRDEAHLKEVLSGADSAEVCLEIGCGNGIFTARLAHSAPEALIIACELDLKRAKKTVQRFHREGLIRCRMRHGTGEELLSWFPEASIDRFYLNFPDPWPKKKHHRRRFFYPQEVLANLIEKLKPGGKIYFVSDHEEYFFFNLEERLKKNDQIASPLEKGFALSLPGYFSTHYEEKFKAMGKPIYYTFFEKI